MSSSLPPAGEPQRSLRLSILEGGGYAMMAAVSGSALLTACAIRLGATDFHFSLLTAVSTLASLGALAGAYSLGRVGSRRGLIMRIVWTRAVWALPAVQLILGQPPSACLAGLLAVIFLQGFFDNAVGNAWMSWMTDLVPAERRSRYFGIRNAVLGSVGMALAWMVGRSYDELDALWAARGHSPLLVFVPFFLFAAAGGLVSQYYMGRKWEPSGHGERPIPFAATIALPFRHAGFRLLLRFYVLWTLVTAISTPFWRPQMINHLDMSLEVISIYAILSGTMNLVTQTVWGRIIDRVGSRPVIAFNLVGVAFLPLFWLFARPDFLWLIWADALLTGFFWPGFNLATFNLNLQSAPRENRASYFAAISVLCGITGFAANLLGGQIALAFHDFSMDLAGFPLNHYHIIFVLSAVGRLLMLPLALRLPDEKSGSMGMLFTMVGDKVEQMLATGLQQGVEVVRRWRR